MKSEKPFMRLDCSFWDDLDIQMMLEDLGPSAVLYYLVICTKMYDFEKYGYNVPYSYVPVLSKVLNISKDETDKVISWCVSHDLFKECMYAPPGKTDACSVICFYSNRRRQELLEMREKRLRQQYGASETNRKKREAIDNEN